MSDADATPAVDPNDVRLEKLAPNPGARRKRKRIGRGPGSGHGKTAGRGHKGQGSRSGKGPIETYQGGQVPIHMQKGKLRGPNHKKSMPFERFRTHSIPVNVGSLIAFDAGSVVDVAALEARGLVKGNKNRKWPVKILAEGDLDRALTVRAHAFSAGAKAKIEAAGGTAEVLPARGAVTAPGADE
jgi:large subunit ribosomal protein L15